MTMVEKPAAGSRVHPATHMYSLPVVHELPIVVVDHQHDSLW